MGEASHGRPRDLEKMIKEPIRQLLHDYSDVSEDEIVPHILDLVRRPFLRNQQILARISDAERPRLCHLPVSASRPSKSRIYLDAKMAVVPALIHRRT